MPATPAPPFDPHTLPRIDARTARLYVIVAREAPVAVVFRRGPGNHTRLLSWDLKTDVLTPGQWLKSRVYERRCDLSPDGKFLVYFAASHRAPYGSWTAISRPPWFTALALWRKGDCWGGGGLFDTRRALRLNHRPTPYRDGVDEMKLRDDFSLPRRMSVAPLGEASGWGEDDPIHAMRLMRDGWTIDETQARMEKHGQGARFWITFAPPLMHTHPIPPFRGARKFTLRVSLHAVHEAQGRSQVLTADILDAEGAVARALGRVDWAGVAPDGDVLLALEGRLHRLALSQPKTAPADAPLREIADLNAMRFEEMEAPAWARRWS